MIRIKIMYKISRIVCKGTIALCTVLIYLNEKFIHLPGETERFEMQKHKFEKLLKN
ncbi:MAG: hypothetical protein K2N34_09930 [Lachnospiraceae bacterium]|nr:hypothetical protein [Lachnospiraceae bacterium]